MLAGFGHERQLAEKDPGCRLGVTHIEYFNNMSFRRNFYQDMPKNPFAFMKKF